MTTLLISPTSKRGRNTSAEKCVATLHRFRDRAAVYLSTCEPTGRNRQQHSSTSYLTAREARALAVALQRIARSIESEPFATSENTNWMITEEVRS